MQVVIAHRRAGRTILGVTILNTRDALAICRSAGVEADAVGLTPVVVYRDADGRLHLERHLADMTEVTATALDLDIDVCRCLSGFDLPEEMAAVHILASVILEDGLDPGPFDDQTTGAGRLAAAARNHPRVEHLKGAAVEVLDRSLRWADEHGFDIRSTFDRHVATPQWQDSLVARCHRMNAFGMSEAAPVRSTEALSDLGTALGLGSTLWFELVDELASLADRAGTPDTAGRLDEILEVCVADSSLSHVDQLHFPLTDDIPAGRDAAEVVQEQWRRFVRRQADVYAAAVADALEADPDTRPMLIGPLAENHRWWGSEELCRLTDLCRRTWRLDRHPQYLLAPAEAAWFISDPDVFGSGAHLQAVPVDPSRPDIIETALALYADAGGNPVSPLSDLAAAVKAAERLT